MHAIVELISCVTLSDPRAVFVVPRGPIFCISCLAEDELFSCVTLSVTRAVLGALTTLPPLGRVPSARRRVHWAGPWPPSTSNNHRCTVNCRFVRSDVACDLWLSVFSESSLIADSDLHAKK